MDKGRFCVTPSEDEEKTTKQKRDPLASLTFALEKLIVPQQSFENRFKCGSKIIATTEKRAVRRRPEFNF